MLTTIKIHAYANYENLKIIKDEKVSTCGKE
jgi:hypothetical protein